ncbi:MAG: DUF3226 domain-containing protein [Candidatus Methanomethylicaceae archaeon]
MVGGIKIEYPKLLVVEGKEEERFFNAFIDHLGLKNIQIFPIGGKDNLGSNLRALVISPDFSKVILLGIIRDANSDPKAAFQSVCSALKAAELPIPEKPWTLAGDRLKVGVIILPNASSSGALEDLCLDAVQGDPAMACVEEYFRCLEQKKLSLPRHISKAKVQVFLASRDRAGLRLGEAAKAGYLPWDAEAFKQIKYFLEHIGLLNVSA